MPNDMTTARRALKTLRDLTYAYGDKWPLHQYQDVQTVIVELEDWIGENERDFVIGR